MTFPTGGAYDVPTVNIDEYCCADPLAGGCGHHNIVDHNGPNTECRGVFGCPCQGVKRHRDGCIHRPGQQPEEVAG